MSSIERHALIRSLARLSLAWLLLWPAAGLAAPTVTVLLSEPGGWYREVADALAARLEAAGLDWKLNLRLISDAAPTEPDALIVPIGLKAFRAAIAVPTTAPVWALMVPRDTVDGLMSALPPQRRARIGALYLDQPLVRYMHLIQAAQPQVRRIGVLFGPHSEKQSEALADAARQAGLILVGESIDAPERLIPALDLLRGRVDLLLLLPDPLVASRASLQVLLLRTYQMRLPVVGYSMQLIEAGATLALYSTPAQIGEEAALRIIEAARRGSLRVPASGFPRHYDLAVNRSVAVSLGLRVPVREDLRARMDKEMSP